MWGSIRKDRENQPFLCGVKLVADCDRLWVNRAEVSCRSGATPGWNSLLSLYDVMSSLRGERQGRQAIA
ncbi:hypothetical protein THAOC_21595 [Thalassiosira oceanica]|uniref:Uncharacterized protein n=1 Tax=Thalassiosira oceanica TaxID=159749 RepID=K0SBK7_THAOC|nr:hypothetical protein THAOC_21595 [Thalassiosira oceanica]|eukprot:EJK58296.1 hypothetical protein THAOC_21595 [Thalassiosira oceanica]